MKKTLFIAFALWIGLNLLAQTNSTCAYIKQQIKDTRAEIDSLSESDNHMYYVDRIDSLNASINNYLELLAEDNLYQECNVSLKYNFFFLRSEDKRFCICSWDTKQGTGMIDFTNTVIYQTEYETKIEKLHYGEKENLDNTKIMFDTLFTIQNDKGEAIYIAVGAGKFAPTQPFKVIRAFMIKEGLVQDFELFPQDEIWRTYDQYQSSSLWVNYDREKFKSKDVVKDFIFLEGGRKILVPIIKDNGRPSNKYYTLFFDGMKFSK